MNAKDDGSKKLSLVYVEAAKADIDSATTDSILFLLKHDSTYIDTVDNEPVYVWNALLDGEEITIESKTIDTTYDPGDVFEDYSIDVYKRQIPACYDVKVNKNWDKYKFVGSELRGKTCLLYTSWTRPTPQ